MAERTLTDLELRILAFEQEWADRVDQDPKHAAVRREFGWSFAAYVQKLYGVIDLPAAVEFDALLVHRLRKLREERVAARQGRVFRHVG